MKKHIFNILKILIFIFVFISFYYFLTVFKRPSGWNQNNTTGLYAERKNSLDMVYLGGSAAFVYFDPIIRGKEVVFLHMYMVLKVYKQNFILIW